MSENLINEILLTGYTFITVSIIAFGIIMLLNILSKR